MNNLRFNSNINEEYFVDIPAHCLNFLFRKFHLFALFEKYAKDGRAKRSTYSIASLLMVAFQMIIFRSPSKIDFYQNKKLGRGGCYYNLGKIAQIKSEGFPHSKTIDDAFLSLNPADLEPILFDIFKALCSTKLFYHYPSLKKNQTYRLDAFCSHHYSDLSQHPCKACPFALRESVKQRRG